MIQTDVKWFFAFWILLGFAGGEVIGNHGATKIIVQDCQKSTGTEGGP